MATMPTGPKPPPPPGTARVAISGTCQGHAWTQVFYLQLTGSAITVNDLQTLANDIEGFYSTNLAASMPSVWALTDIKIVYIPSAGSEVVYEGTYSLVGTNAGTIVDNAASCLVIRWAISAYYRGGHPRTYMPGVMTSLVTNGSNIDPTNGSAFATKYNAIRNGINATTTTNITAVVMGTVSFQSGNAWRVTPVFRPFTSVSYNPKLGSQRRRIKS